MPSGDRIMRSFGANDTVSTETRPRRRCACHASGTFRLALGPLGADAESPLRERLALPGAADRVVWVSGDATLERVGAVDWTNRIGASEDLSVTFEALRKVVTDSRQGSERAGTGDDDELAEALEEAERRARKAEGAVSGAVSLGVSPTAGARSAGAAPQATTAA